MFIKYCEAVVSGLVVGQISGPVDGRVTKRAVQAVPVLCERGCSMALPATMYDTYRGIQHRHDASIRG